jgi:hypothetical protein
VAERRFQDFQDARFVVNEENRSGGVGDGTQISGFWEFSGYKTCVDTFFERIINSFTHYLGFNTEVE